MKRGWVVVMVACCSCSLLQKKKDAGSEPASSSTTTSSTSPSVSAVDTASVAPSASAAPEASAAPTTNTPAAKKGRGGACAHDADCLKPFSCVSHNKTKTCEATSGDCKAPDHPEMGSTVDGEPLPLEYCAQGAATKDAGVAATDAAAAAKTCKTTDDCAANEGCETSKCVQKCAPSAIWIDGARCSTQTCKTDSECAPPKKCIASAHTNVKVCK